LAIDELARNRLEDDASDWADVAMQISCVEKAVRVLEIGKKGETFARLFRGMTA
jgi:hypothetical protein